MQGNIFKLGQATCHRCHSSDSVLPSLGVHALFAACAEQAHVRHAVPQCIRMSTASTHGSLRLPAGREDQGKLRKGTATIGKSGS